MYARLITVPVHPSRLEEFAATFGEQILPEVCRERGYKSTYMLKDAGQTRVTVLVFWESESDAQASLKGSLERRLPEMQGFLASPPTAETWEVILRA